MREHIKAELRRLVIARADYRCEYCLIHEEDTFFGCEVDHVVSVKHGGATEAGNLAYACQVCNRQKGSDLGSLARRTGELVRFYNPRADRWADHFRLGAATITSITDIGEVTARIFGFNREERLMEREELIAQGRYP